MGSLMQAADLPASEFDAFAVGRDGEAIARALRPLLDAGYALRGRLQTWADGMADNCWENVAYVRRMAAEDVAPREVEPAALEDDTATRWSCDAGGPQAGESHRLPAERSFGTAPCTRECTSPRAAAGRSGPQSCAGACGAGLGVVPERLLTGESP